MQRKWTIATVLLSVALGTLFMGCKHHDGDFFSPEEHISHVINKLEKELNLDAAQKEELLQITSEIKTKMADMKTEKKAKQQEIVTLIRQEQVSTDDLDVLITQHQQKMEALAEFAGQEFIRLHTLLTPEQREKLAVMLESHIKDHCR
jgi:septal ring factor EnvC (AmiA/AmiB activator)